MSPRLQRYYDKLSSIAYGGDYNPEQWTKAVWAEDAELMSEARVNLATVGIFSWAVVEPRPGAYDFGWLDEHLDRLAAGGQAVCLATMTASPPAWLSQAHPEILPVTEDGVRLSTGSRQHYCPSSPVYRDHAVRLAEKVAERYGDHPALALWHIGNEYGCHISRHCYCDVSAEAFRGWLRDRYGTVEALNDAWSTTFWSQRYGTFDEVLPPRKAPSFRNPTQQIDFQRFSSDEMLKLYLAEKAVLDRITPDIPVTTNFVPVAKTLDLFKWAKEMDVVSYDSYPDPHDPGAAHLTAFSYDVMRGLKDGQPWLLMEQCTSAVNWRDVNGAKPRGRMELDSWQAVAHGADSILFFQWRQSRGGAEKYHAAMVPHGGRDTRTFRRVRELGADLAAHPELFGARPQRADAGLLFSWDNWWGLELLGADKARPSHDVRQMDTALAHHKPLYDASVACDILSPDADLSPYKLLVVPNLYLVTEAQAKALEEWVAAGGTLLMSYFSGIVDEADRVHLGGYPAPFRRLLGLTVDEWDPLPSGGTLGLSYGPAATGSVWSEWVEPEGAETLATFTEGELAGRPAVTRHRFGRGTAYYLATRPDAATMRAVVDEVRAQAGVEPVLAGLPEGVQARTRVTADGVERHVVLNHTEAEVTVAGRAIPARGTAVV
ncbi:beta-galactosidase [Streptomyces boninensis]|uniref:beta-galactosidase n=1 Tax=Streptomyces boninensis TaxID=2039455 RepID=UPI003B2176FF